MFVRYLLIALLFIPSLSYAQDQQESQDQQQFEPMQFPDNTALVVFDRSIGDVNYVNQSQCERKLAPCSTFKIFNTLIGLELGLLPGSDDPWYTWDGITRDFEAWNTDLTLRQAFRVSCVPAFQGLARQIGSARMQLYINKIRYGTLDISSGIDLFWLPRREENFLKISAVEQVELLNELLDNKLPFDLKNIDVLLDIMQVSETEKATLYGKTGSSGTDVDEADRVGWFVGFLVTEESIFVFACNVTGENPSGKDAREIVEQYFRSLDLL